MELNPADDHPADQSSPGRSPRDPSSPDLIPPDPTVHEQDTPDVTAHHEGAPDAPADAGTSERIDLDELERELQDVETALSRLDDGSYWVDEVTGNPLADELLAAQPTTRTVTTPQATESASGPHPAVDEHHELDDTTTELAADDDPDVMW